MRSFGRDLTAFYLGLKWRYSIDWHVTCGRRLVKQIKHMCKRWICEWITTFTTEFTTPSNWLIFIHICVFAGEIEMCGDWVDNLRASGANQPMNNNNAWKRIWPEFINSGTIRSMFAPLSSSTINNQRIVNRRKPIFNHKFSIRSNKKMIFNCPQYRESCFQSKTNQAKLDDCWFSDSGN